MSKRAFFVVGPESSGTRMMTRALILLGAYENESFRHGNQNNFSLEGDLVVIHRSLPHAKEWPDLRKIYQSLIINSYCTTVIVMVRDWNATIRSQLKRGFVDTANEAERRIRWAIQTIINQLPDFIMVTYEAFINYPGFRKWLFVERLGLPESPIDIWPANEQYYD